MQIDQRFVQNLQNENAFMRQEIGRLNNVLKTVEEKYQRSLKQMSSIMHANQNFRQEFDNIKLNMKDQIENSVREVRNSYEVRIQQLVKQKNDLAVLNDNLNRQKQQLQRDYTNIQQNLWQFESLKKQNLALKNQNDKLLLQTHPLTHNQQNPQQKAVEQKLSQKIEELNSKIAQLTVQITQSKKYADSLQSQKQNLQKQVQSLAKKNNQLSQSVHKVEMQRTENRDMDAKSIETKKHQMEVLDLRKINTELTNQIQKLKLEKLEMTSQINKNQAELNLLSTLKSLHSQLQPMRYEVEQLKRDKYFERENTNKEKAQTQMKLLSAEHQLQTLKQHIKDIQLKNKDLSQTIREKQWEKNKFQELQEEKRILEGRVIVYQAMELVGRNRDKPHHIQRIQEFQRRIQLLLQQQNLQYLVNNANVHQLIAMKAYVIELDNKLQIVLEQNQHLIKKYGQYKDRYKQMVAENKQIISKHYATVNAFKGKISGYEKLIMKLTEELERFIKDNQNLGIQSHYKSVITLYESKILSIHNQINAKKQENRQLLKKHQNLQLELKGKLALIRQLQSEIANLKSNVKDLSTKLATRSLQQETRKSVPINNIPEDYYKNIISQKTKQILDLEQKLSKIKLQLDKKQFEHDREMDNLKHKINRLQIQNEQLRLEQSEAQKQLSTAKHSQQFGELVEKMSMLERNIAAMSKSQTNINIQQPRKSMDQQYEKQIAFLKQQNQYLTQELQNLRNELKRRLSNQNISIVKGEVSNQEEIQRIRDQARRHSNELQNRVLELEAEVRLKQKEIQIKSRQLERSSIGQSQISVQQPISQGASLQQQNAHLRAELERMNENNKLMKIQSANLMNKIRQAQAYILELKQSFGKVGSEMNRYQKQLEDKDHIIYQLKLKLQNLHQKHGIQISDIQHIGNMNADRNLQERQRRLKQAEAEFQRLKREVEAKFRDLERLEMELNRRQSQIQMKNRDLVGRIRKLEQRERIVSQQQSRLTNWSHQLEQKQRNLQNFQVPTPQTPINQFNDQIKKQQLQQLERLVKRLEIQLNQKIKTIQIKDQKISILQKQKNDLFRQLSDLRPEYEQKRRLLQFNQKQLSVHKQEAARLEGQLENLWRDFDSLKQQLRNKERQLSDAQFEKQQIRTRFQIQIKQLQQTLLDSQNSQNFQPAKVVPSPDNQKYIMSYKQQIKRLESQLQIKWKQVENLKQQLRNKERQLNEAGFEIEQVRRKQQAQIRQLKQKIRQLQSKIPGQSTHSPQTSKGSPSKSVIDYNERQLQVYKQENARLEGELQQLWRQFDSIKHQLRNKQRQLNEASFDKQDIKRKFQLQIRLLNQRLRQNQNDRLSQSQNQPKSPDRSFDYSQIERQFEERLRGIEQRNKEKIKQLYKQNEQNTRQLQQTISDLEMELKRFKMQSISPSGKHQIEAQTAVVQSLETHLSILQQQIQRKQQIINQLEGDLQYYKEIVAQRELEIQRLYESTYVPSKEGDISDTADKFRLQNQIIALQNMLQRQNESMNNHDQCIKKQHVLRMEIERLNSIRQSKLNDSKSDHGSERPPLSPHTQYLDNSYLLQLEENNKKLQEDLAVLRQRLLVDFDTKRSIQDYLAILAITFAQVDALRQRVYELQQNFKEEHERQLSVIKKLDDLKQHDLDIQKILQILRELQISHRAFHEQQQRSKSTFIKKINTEVLVAPGSQNISIVDEINKNLLRNQHSAPGIIPFPSLNNFVGSNALLGGRIQINQPNRPIDFGQRSIKLSLNEEGLGSSGFNPNLPFPIGHNPMNFSSSLTGINRSLSSNLSQGTGSISIPQTDTRNLTSSLPGLGGSLGSSISGPIGGPIGGSIGTSFGGGVLGTSIGAPPPVPNPTVNMFNTPFGSVGASTLGTTSFNLPALGNTSFTPPIPVTQNQGSTIGSIHQHNITNNFSGPVGSQTNFRYGVFDSQSSGINSSSYQSPSIQTSSRPGSFSILPQPVHFSSSIREQSSQGQRTGGQPMPFYQKTQSSQSSFRFPSETNISMPTPASLNYSGSESNLNPYMMSGNQLLK